MDKFYSDMTLKEKVDWFFLFIDSRSPIIPRQAHHRHWNQIRETAHSLLFKLNFPEDLSELSEGDALKLTYALYRGKTNMTDHITDSLSTYVENSLESGSLSERGAVLFFIYFSEINGKKSIENQALLSSLKDRIIGNWESYDKINQVRALYGMLVLNLYDEGTH